MPPKTRKKARLSQKNERRPLASLSENVFTPPSKKKRNEEELRKMHHSHQLQLLSLSNVKAKTKCVENTDFVNTSLNLSDLMDDESNGKKKRPRKSESKTKTTDRYSLRLRKKSAASKIYTEYSSDEEDDDQYSQDTNQSSSIRSSAYSRSLYAEERNILQNDWRSEGVIDY